jgi:beta-phosphoglucomutase-like phosphatase (HAD superfamily)
VGVKAALAAGLRVVQIPDLVPVTKPSSPPFHLIADTLATGIGWLKIDT